MSRIVVQLCSIHRTFCFENIFVLRVIVLRHKCRTVGCQTVCCTVNMLNKIPYCFLLSHLELNRALSCIRWCWMFHFFMLITTIVKNVHLLWNLLENICTCASQNPTLSTCNKLASSHCPSPTAAWLNSHKVLRVQAAVFHYGSISLIAEPCRSAHLRAMEIAKEAGALLKRIVKDPSSLQVSCLKSVCWSKRSPWFYMSSWYFSFAMSLKFDVCWLYRIRRSLRRRLNLLMRVEQSPPRRKGRSHPCPLKLRSCS